MSGRENYAEEIKKSLEEADLEFKTEHKEYEQLLLDGYGALNEALKHDLPDSMENYSDDEELFLLLFQQAIIGLEDMYISLRRRRYTAVRRDMRYIYESIILLDKTIDDPEWASEIRNKFKKEAAEEKDSLSGISHSAPETTQKLSDKAGELHKEIVDDENAMSGFSQYLGVSGSHPYNFEGMNLNGKRDEINEESYLTYAINFSYGLITMFLMEFNGERVSSEKFEELMELSNDQLQILDHETFVFIQYFSDFEEEIDT